MAPRRGGQHGEENQGEDSAQYPVTVDTAFRIWKLAPHLLIYDLRQDRYSMRLSSHYIKREHLEAMQGWAWLVLGMETT